MGIIITIIEYGAVKLGGLYKNKSWFGA